MTKKIPLSRGHFAIVDDEDFERLAQHRWWATSGLKRSTFYAARKDEGRKTVLMHRDILNPGSGELVDHIDGNPLNNTRANLRVCSNAENMCNRRLHRNNSSGFKGVVKFRKRFKAQIRVGGDQLHLGVFSTPEEAARAYDAAAIEHHGQFARLNFSV